MPIRDIFIFSLSPLLLSPVYKWRIKVQGDSNLLDVTEERHVLWSGFKPHHTPLKGMLLLYPMPPTSPFTPMLTKPSSARDDVGAGVQGSLQALPGRVDSYMDSARRSGHSQRGAGRT